jgi:predicted short-subunit dehydrogenase-like oxidoreductase (DUF2520 family)
LRIRIIGRGRAGGALAGALAGRAAVETLGRGPNRKAASGVDLLVLAVPDQVIAHCAMSIEPGDAVVSHLSGATLLSALSPHARVASLHPLVSIPDPIEGARRIRGAWMAVAGDPLINEVAGLLDGRTFQVDDAHRALYHATAAIAANHLVALMGQVERLAALIGVPSRPFLDLAVGALANTVDSGAAAALTGPVTRNDWETVRRHLAALPATEHALYLALMGEVAATAGRDIPLDLRQRLVR